MRVFVCVLTYTVVDTYACIFEHLCTLECLTECAHPCKAYTRTPLGELVVYTCVPPDIRVFPLGFLRLLLLRYGTAR